MIKDILSEVESMLSASMVGVRRFRSQVARLRWFAGVVPRLRWAVNSVYAVVTEVDKDRQDLERSSLSIAERVDCSYGRLALGRRGDLLGSLTFSTSFCHISFQIVRHTDFVALPFLLVFLFVRD